MSDTLPTGDPEGTIPVPQAMDMTANWRAYLASSEQVFNVRSYYVPIINLTNILLYNPTAEAVRAYIGLTDPADPTTSQLLLIPIVDGKEVPYVPNANKGSGTVGDDDGSNIYDFSNPCPPQCGGGGGLDGD